ncbi:MAG: hypothetical protein JO356_08680 [Acidobacteria bacterium]|nr:hypothetical protein [Acidobacteriota bacterium]
MANNSLYEYIRLRAEIAELEVEAEKHCGCDPANFERCIAHERLQELEPRLRYLRDTYAGDWATRLAQWEGHHAS